MQETKLYFSGKNKLYGYKTEVAVSSRGYALDCTSHAPGSVADIDIFMRNIDFHQAEIEKSEYENARADHGIISDKCPQQWGILADMGY